MNIGSTSTNTFKVGSLQADKIMLGSDKIWENIVFVGGSVDNELDGDAENAISIDYPTGTQVGDLAFVAISLDKHNSGIYTSSGWSIININTVTSVYSYLYYKQVTDLTTVSFSGVSGDGATAVMGVFRGGIPSFPASTVIGSAGMPNPPSKSLSSSGSTVITIGHLNNDQTVATAFGGYIMVASRSNYHSVPFAGTFATTTMMAYKEKLPSGTEDPGAFIGFGDDNWVAHTIEIATQ